MINDWVKERALSKRVIQFHVDKVLYDEETTSFFEVFIMTYQEESKSASRTDMCIDKSSVMKYDTKSGHLSFGDHRILILKT